MKMIKRAYDIAKLVRKGKVLVIYGARQVGKTTLVEEFIARTRENSKKRIRYVTGDDFDAARYLGSGSLKGIEEFVSGYDLLIIDEAQKIPNIGNALKLIVDRIKTIEVIVTGSASFELAGQVGEPLTGRKRTITLFPISQWELSAVNNPSELKEMLADVLVFGSYPEIVKCGRNTEEKRVILHEIVSSYLLKDLLELEDVKSSQVLINLLRLLAFQIGSEVSLSELGNKLDIHKRTVARYIDLLEKTFILRSVSGYSRNLRKEVTKMRKYYFYDLGVRNTLIGNFNNIDVRDDVGKLWENFIFIERLKKRTYERMEGNEYFWRTWDQKEIDLVEERDGSLFGYEFKLVSSKAREPKLWKETYVNAKYEVIDQDNYLSFITK